MKFVHFLHDGISHLGLVRGERVVNLGRHDLGQMLRDGVDLVRFGEETAEADASLALSEITFLPPLSQPPKIICVGLNYADHTSESPYEQPAYPTIFNRFNTSLIGHEQAMVRPLVSDSLDFEGELAVILKSGGRHISRDQALDHVAGYSIFNDGSVREYQFKSPQWTVGKNFDGTGAFGPYLVTADELPAGARGLRLQTTLNGVIVQSANTSDMLFDVASLISILSEAVTLEAGDVIVAGTPAGIGWAREPKLLMKQGDVCEVAIEGLGVLRSPVMDEVRSAQR
jgi:2-keto-4-pentenoate hydratase/2-oxohepta-3-ene-1,7-dioic acid hydratase in catechol pathway